MFVLRTVLDKARKLPGHKLDLSRHVPDFHEAHIPQRKLTSSDKLAVAVCVLICRSDHPRRLGKNSQGSEIIWLGVDSQRIR